MHYYSLSRGLTLTSFSPMILCNFIDSLDDNGVYEQYGSLEVVLRVGICYVFNYSSIYLFVGISCYLYFY